MFEGQPRLLVCVAAAALLTAPAAALATAQEHSSQDSAAQNSSAKQPEKKPALTEATRVSTDDAVRNSAKEEAKKAGADKTTEEPQDASVLELRPAAEAAGSGGAGVAPKSSKKAPLKDVHGRVYGSSDAKNPGTHRTGGAVGASSKSGKTSVYVETEGSRTPTPR